MSMITRCPACGTAFRVTPPQLQAQHGMVRCGRCAHVFDGFATLATRGDERPPETATQPAIAARAAEPAAPATPSAVVAASAVAVTVPPAPAVTPPPVIVAPLQPPQAVSPATASAPRAPVPPVPVALTPDEPRRPQRRSGGALGIMVMLVALAAQGAYFYRSEIAASFPEARPALDRMCQLLGCTAGLPQRPQQISIEGSDMEPDPAAPRLIALTATLRNHASTELGYPALDVVLTDTRDHTVARRVFLPAEYRDAGKDTRTGIPPNAEITIRLNIDSGDLRAAGYRLALLPAPRY